MSTEPIPQASATAFNAMIAVNGVIVDHGYVYRQVEAAVAALRSAEVRLTAAEARVTECRDQYETAAAELEALTSTSQGREALDIIRSSELERNP